MLLIIFLSFFGEEIFLSFITILQLNNIQHAPKIITETIFFSKRKRKKERGERGGGGGEDR